MEIAGMNEHTKCLSWVLGYPINSLDNHRSTFEFKCMCDRSIPNQFVILMQMDAHFVKQTEANCNHYLHCNP